MEAHLSPLLENEYFWPGSLQGVIFSTKSITGLTSFCSKKRKIGYADAQAIFEAITLPLDLNTEPFILKGSPIAFL